MCRARAGRPRRLRQRRPPPLGRLRPAAPGGCAPAAPPPTDPAVRPCCIQDHDCLVANCGFMPSRRSLLLLPSDCSARIHARTDLDAQRESSWRPAWSSLNQELLSWVSSQAPFILLHQPGSASQQARATAGLGQVLKQQHKQGQQVCCSCRLHWEGQHGAWPASKVPGACGQCWSSHIPMFIDGCSAWPTFALAGSYSMQWRSEACCLFSLGCQHCSQQHGSDASLGPVRACEVL